VYDNPHEFVQLLARNLPRQDAYFMQLLTVSTCIGSLLELSRVVPLFQAAVRTLLLGRNDLTEKQKRQPIGPFLPLCVVDKIYFSRLQARFLLYFMVLFVYSTISPLINWFCCIFFLFLGSVYRHQFIYNYPNTPDSGGVMWLMFMAVVLACIVIAELTLWGFLGIKKAGVAISTMIPLMVMTALFIVYLIQNFFSLGQYLPAHTGLGQDLDNAEAGVDFEPFRNMYRHPALGVLEQEGGDIGGGVVASTAATTTTTTLTTGAGPSSSSSPSSTMMKSSSPSPLPPRPPVLRRGNDA
jgi:Calcium-dependent channel, 7TM region, putative phosphate